MSLKSSHHLGKSHTLGPIRVPSLVLGVFLTILSLSATANARSSSLGADVGVLMREEGGGTRTPLLQAGPRFSLPMLEWMDLSLSYAFSLHNEGMLSAGSTQYHRLALRPEVLIPIKAGNLVLSAGPALHLTWTQLYFRGEQAAASTFVRPAFHSLVGFDVFLSKLTLRAAASGVYSSRRFDIGMNLGAVFPLGSAP